MKPVLILGGDGLLGKHLVNAIQHGNEFTSYTVSRTGKTNFNSDITVKSNLENIIREIKPSYIINLVAITDVDFCEVEVEQSYKVHVSVCKFLAQLECTYGYKVLHLSTDQVYDKANSKECDVLPKNVYALTKQMGELELTKNSTVLRTNFFGKSMTKGRHSLTDIMFDKAKREEQISLLDDVFFSPLSIYSLTKYIMVTIKNWNPGIYNLGSKLGMSKADFVLSFLEQLEFDRLDYKFISSKQFNFKAVRPSDMRMDVTHFENVYTTNLPSLEKEIKQVIKDYK